MAAAETQHQHLILNRLGLPIHTRPNVAHRSADFIMVDASADAAASSPVAAGPPPSSAAISSMNAVSTGPALSFDFDAMEDVMDTKPSHDYSLFPQLTGIPSGSVDAVHQANLAMASVPPVAAPELASLDASSLVNFDFPVGSQTGLPMPSALEVADFHPMSIPVVEQNYSLNDLINSDSMVASEENHPNVRFFPGMHSQQAASLAKAQAQALKGAAPAAAAAAATSIARPVAKPAAMSQPVVQVSKSMDQPAGVPAHQQPPAQQPQPQQQQQRRFPQINKPQGSAPAQRRSISNSTVDARTEEAIARVMRQIRQSSAAEGESRMDSHPTGLQAHSVKPRKDESEMDEDERLLASEAGKKLSSKERRQLRNKVSARAFRSRRKEYIGQLEAQVNAKTGEYAELMAKHQALAEENARASAMLRLLLGHPAFGSFLDDAKRNPEALELNLLAEMNAAATARAPAPPTIPSNGKPQMEASPMQTTATTPGAQGVTPPPAMFARRGSATGAGAGEGEPVDLRRLQLDAEAKGNKMNGSWMPPLRSGGPSGNGAGQNVVMMMQPTDEDDGFEESVGAMTRAKEPNVLEEIMSWGRERAPYSAGSPESAADMKEE